MFPGVAKLGNMFRTQNLCPGSKNVFDSRQKHFLFSEQQNLFPQHMFPARLNWETFASATKFPSLAKPELVTNSGQAFKYHRDKKMLFEIIEFFLVLNTLRSFTS